MNNDENIFNALDHTKKAMPSKTFLLRMENVALAYTAKLKSFSRLTLVGIAAAFVLLVSANFLVVQNYQSQNTQEIETSVLESYNLVPIKSIY